MLRSGELMSEVLRCGGGEEQETLHHPHQHPILLDIDLYSHSLQRPIFHFRFQIDGGGGQAGGQVLQIDYWWLEQDLGHRTLLPDYCCRTNT